MEYYTWILSLHIIAVLSWMAMLFYLPRLFVYHVENSHKKEFVEVVKNEMEERRLQRRQGGGGIRRNKLLLAD